MLTRAATIAGMIATTSLAAAGPAAGAPRAPDPIVETPRPQPPPPAPRQRPTKSPRMAGWLSIGTTLGGVGLVAIFLPIADDAEFRHDTGVAQAQPPRRGASRHADRRDVPRPLDRRRVLAGFTQVVHGARPSRASPSRTSAATSRTRCVRDIRSSVARMLREIARLEEQTDARRPRCPYHQRRTNGARQPRHVPNSARHRASGSDESLGTRLHAGLLVSIHFCCTERRRCLKVRSSD